MRRVLPVLIFIIVFIYISPACGATPKLEIYRESPENEPAGQVIWRLSGLDKLVGDIMPTPEGNLLLPTGKKMIFVNAKGAVVSEIKMPSGTGAGNPVLTGKGSIFTATASSIQETKLNGARGWGLSVYPAGKGAKSSLLAGGPGDLLYLPHSTALYAVDLSGRLAWMLPWNTTDTRMTKLPDREFPAVVSGKKVVYTVYGSKKEGFRLAAANENGEFLWNYWLGDVKQAYLKVGPGDRLFATVSPKSIDRLNKGTVYCFNANSGGRPQWSCRIAYNDLSAPALCGDTLYMSAGKKVYAVDAGTGSIIWHDPIKNLASPPAADSGTGRVYAGSSDNYVFVLSSTGRSHWLRELDGQVTRAPLAGADGYLYIFTDKGSLYKIKDNWKE